MATLKGIWVFNEQLPRDYAPLVENEFYNMNFTSNGVNFTSIHVTDIDADEDFVTQLWYDYTPVADGYMWSYMTFDDANYRTIDFGSTEQTVDDTFYTWLTENATQQASEETSAVTVEYNSSVVATIPSGNKATLPVKDLKMKTDIVITVPKAESGTDSAIPIEVATEAEMTALLTSGEVGGVYKYTGTTGTYENGALYVLEVELGTFTYTQSSAWYSTPIAREFPLGMTWAEFISSEYNAIAQDGQGDYAVVGQFIMRDDGQVMFSGNDVNGTDAHTLAVYYDLSTTLVYGADVILDEGIYDSTHNSGGGGSN